MSPLARFARNRLALCGTVILAMAIAMAISAPFLFPTDPLRMTAPPELWPMEDWAYPLGTDAVGRDIAAVIFHGAGTTLLIGVTAAVLSTAIGITVGAVAGYFSERVDDLLSRVTEVFQTIPHLVFLICLTAALGKSIDLVVVGIGVVSWPGVARLTRAEFLALREREFVLACQAMGMSSLRIMLVQALPNALPPIITIASVSVGSAILFESTLSFLGLSDPDIASWGRLIGDGRGFIRTSWYISAIPGVAILLTVLSLNLIGDGINDAFNPRLMTATRPWKRR